MNLVRKSLSTWINAAIILTVGILIIVGGAVWLSNSNPENAFEAISIVLGVVALIIGSLSLLLAIWLGVMAKKSFLLPSLAGGVMLALGISLVVLKYAFPLIQLLVAILPYLLIVVGALFALDGCWSIYRSLKAKKSLVPAIIVIVCGAVLIVLGALCVGNDPVIKNQVQLIIFGVVLVLEACFMVLSTLIKTPDVVIVAKEK